MRRRIFITTLSTLLLVCGAARSAVRSYSIIIGNNAPPAGNSTLPTLRYADDDAVRYYRFFHRLTDDVYLLTVPDAATQRRYPGVASRAKPPTIKHLTAAVQRIARDIAAAARSGDETVVYLTFSGHGDHTPNGEPFLSFLDGPVVGATLYREVFEKLEADYLHVFIDACYAKGILGFRGPFDDASDSERVAISDREMQAAFGQLRQEVSPGLGLIISSSRNDKAHEWSKIESGVFTHEVLSGISGPADINLDGRIEYSELVSFISAANLEVADSRGKLDVIARPPRRNHNVPIVDLTDLRSVSFLHGDPSVLGHFSIELRSGERYLDANLSNSREAHIAIPKDETAYLYTEHQEAEIRGVQADVIGFDRLTFNPRRIIHRGGIESALQEGLFAADYSKAYYQGFVESRSLSAVRFDAPRMIRDSREADAGGLRKPLAITGFVLAGTSAVAAAVLGTLSIRTRNDLETNFIERDAQKLNDRYKAFSNGFWVSAALVPVGAIVGIVLWPKRRAQQQAVRVTGGVRALSLSVSF